MKRINYDGLTLITGSAVADALVDYAATVARMNSAMSVDIPVLEENGSIATHTLLLSKGNTIEIFDVDGSFPGPEDERFPVPDFPAVGGDAVAVSPEEIEGVGTPMPDD